MIDFSFDVNNIEYFLLIFVRISIFVYIAPFFNTKGIPRQVKIAYSAFMASLLYNAIPVKPDLAYNTVWGYAMIVLKEAMTGALLGFGASICNGIVGFAGRIIDMETGMSMANLVDPTSNEMESISGVLYQYVITLMLLISGMYQYIIKALAESFELIPVNGAIFNNDKLMQSMLQFLKDYMSIGFRIVLPVFAIMLLLNAVLGIMTKVAPQMNMFSVGMQLKVLTGLTALFITVGMMPTVSSWIFTEVKKMMVSFAGTML